MSETYLIALGSNMRVPGLGGPRVVIEAAFAALSERGLKVVATSPVIDSAPIGPSLRRYANAVALLETPMSPPALLAMLHQLERAFGRGNGQRRGQRWRARVLDLDIVLWSGGVWSGVNLTVPHREFRARDFVLEPARWLVPQWRDPLTGLSVAHLAARLAKPTAKGA